MTTRYFKTTGDAGQDKQWDNTLHRLARLEALQSAPTNNPAPTQVVTVSGQSGLTVQQSDGSVTVNSCTTLQVDLAAGFAITANAPYALITRTATVIVPLVASGSGSAGTSILSANEDHVHPVSGVTSLAVSGALISKSGATGAVTLTVAVPILAADPGSPAAGDIWFNTTTSMLSLYTGSATKRAGMV